MQDRRVVLFVLLVLAALAGPRFAGGAGKAGDHFKVIPAADGRGEITLVGNGLNYQDAAGNWIESKPVVQEYPNATICTGATYQVILAANLNTHGSVDLELPPDPETGVRARMISHPLGLAFYDPETGDSVLLARLQDCAPEVVSNKVVYADAFTGPNGIEGAITYTYGVGHFHQDVILTARPTVTPADFGMGVHTRLEILTEFVAMPAPVITEKTLQTASNSARPALVDQTLDYGLMRMGMGRAFATPELSLSAAFRDALPVVKQLVNIENRTVLTEAVEWNIAAAALEKLPRASGTNAVRQASVTRPVSRGEMIAQISPPVVRLNEERATARNGTFPDRLAETQRLAPPQLAALDAQPSDLSLPTGFVIDYELVQTCYSFTFQSGQTYLINSYVSIGYATFESGSVTKFASGQLAVNYYLTCPNSGPKAVLTDINDDSVGDMHPSSAHHFTGYHGSGLDLSQLGSSVYLGNLDIRFMAQGIYGSDIQGVTCFIYGCWFFKCGVGVFAGSPNFVYVSSADFCQVSTPMSEYVSFNYYYCTTCAVTDRDADGLPDAWEMQNFAGLSQNAAGDYDGDGLTNLQEFQLGLNPTEMDTDGNGIADADEDPDGDGLGNAREYVVGTSPTNPDTGSTGTTDAYKDADGDGLTNLEEFEFGTNPLVPNVAAPIFYPVGGSYSSAQNVVITCPTAGATIRYTLNGDEPTASSTSIASGSSVSVSSQTLNAKAWKTSWTTSDTESQSYVVEAQPSNEAPTVTVSPSGNASFLASDSIEILVEAEDVGGTIAKVQLYRGNYIIAETTSSPLRYTVANVPSGTYVFTAKAIDNDGAVTVSSSVTLTINASGPVVSLVGAQPFYTSSPGTLIARITGVNPGALSTLTLNGNAIPKRTGEFTINVPLTEGENTFTLLANGTAEAIAKVYLDSTVPVIAITAPANSSSFNTERINVSGTFTESSLKQITVNGVRAFTGSGIFEALNVPLGEGENTITATAEDIAGNETTTSITVNGSATPVDPVQLAASPVGGFVSLVVTFTPTASVPGTLQYVYYDFDGDGDAEQTETDLDPITHTYTGAGEYFPVVTVQTTAGRFSSLGGWNSTTPDRLRINVQVAPVTDSTISVTDPIDLKTTANGHLYVLSRSTETITQYDASHSVVRTIADIGATPTGLDVDANGNVYVALSGAHQIAKFNPDGNTFALDNTFGTAGLVGGAGSGNGEFNTPYDIAVSPNGAELSVSDSGNHRIQRFNSDDGTFLGAFGSSGSGVGQFNTPKGLVYDEVGHLYIVDSGNNRVVMAESTTVVEMIGSAGTLLGLFQGAVNLDVGGRGIYVADTGNTRLQVFDPIEEGCGSAHTTFSVRLPITASQFTPALSQPSAVAQIADFLAEKIYVADTGNNRVLKVTLPETSSPGDTWAAMKTHIINNGNLAEAAAQFPSGARDDYLRAFQTIGLTKLTADINAIGTLTPVYIEGDQAQYYFEQTIEGQLLLFPVDFVKENGVWKILEF